MSKILQVTYSKQTHNNTSVNKHLVYVHRRERLPCNHGGLYHVLQCQVIY